MERSDLPPVSKVRLRNLLQKDSAGFAFVIFFGLNIYERELKIKVEIYHFFFKAQPFRDVIQSSSQSHLTEARNEATLHVHLLGIFVILPLWRSKATFLDVLLALVKVRVSIIVL